jgi:large subunit ribosomal protein L18
MMQKKDSRLRRSRATRVRIGLQKADRLTVSRTNSHIYASVISGADGKVVCSASTLEAEVRNQLASAKGKGGNVNAAKLVGARLAEKAKAKGVESVAFDRAGYRFHGRVKALAEAAREAGLKF